MSKNFLVLGYGFKIKPLASAPSPANDGDVYYDSTLSTFRIHENGAWNDIGGTTLQQAYDAEGAGADVELTVSSTNGPLVIAGDLPAQVHVEKALRLFNSSSSYLDLTVSSNGTPYSLKLPSTSPSEESFLTVSSAGVADWSKKFSSDLPQNTQASAYTLVSTDAGKHVAISSGGVTIPSDIFSVGNTVTIYNDSSSSQTLTEGSSVTLRLAGTGSTGNRTLAEYGLATILCITGGSSPTFVVTGGGVS